MSNVIKSFAYYALDDKKLVESTLPAHLLHEEYESGDQLTPEQQQELTEATNMKDQILQDAEAFANEQIHQAMQECSALREQTHEEINAWWATRRAEDEEHVALSRQSGFEEGYQQGTVQAEEVLRQEYSEMLTEAQSVLEQAYKLKQQIIHESEPFLIELSTSIAEKVIGRQLTLNPEWVIELIQNVLSRRREKGIIALCVAPSQFAYIQDAREELLTSIDSQAELQIIPDSTVQDRGCVIRSSFGSIDARIDTQLKEIKSALQQLATQSEGIGT
ncbi:FliH/SctL family protein [Paenibacillus planticolens]|uniref:Flagellar assembly protein FliH n=1 Tax=Paenibacillus planticolens TaxID=2654976 RepID=A0ABX1ZVU4_9BACL|nr:FliH/SctL family protein [Paenibacillus planticolens]NOV03170.1 flagellar assembly protein FliH [Paenibacillus planticolens]